LTAATPQIPRPRIQGLSDLIFGLALSIGAILFVGNLPPKPDMLTTDLAGFGFSFLILINVWNRYTATTSVIPVETSMMIRLNMLLLFLVAIEPFLFDVLFVEGLGTDVGNLASLYYGLDVGCMNLILAYFTHILASEEKKLIPQDLVHRYKRIRNSLILGAAIFLISDLPFFLDFGFEGLPLRVWVWILTIPVIWSQRLLGKQSW
jgi:uncharacterized membrane protein